MWQFRVCALLLSLRTLPSPWRQAQAYPGVDKRLHRAKLMWPSSGHSQPASPQLTHQVTTDTWANTAKISLDPQNPPPTYRLMRNYKLCCFTPLDYGVVHYTGIANWYKMEAGLKPRSSTFCSLDSFLYSVWISHVFLNNPSLQRGEKCQCHPRGIG